MAGVLNTALISHKLQYALGTSPSYASWAVGLFISSSISPLCTDAASVYTTSTAECSISGYARAQLPYSAWSGGIASCVYSVRPWVSPSASPRADRPFTDTFFTIRLLAQLVGQRFGVFRSPSRLAAVPCLSTSFTRRSNADVQTVASATPSARKQNAGVRRPSSHLSGRGRPGRRRAHRQPHHAERSYRPGVADLHAGAWVRPWTLDWSSSLPTVPILLDGTSRSPALSTAPRRLPSRSTPYPVRNCGPHHAQETTCQPHSAKALMPPWSSLAGRKPSECLPLPGLSRSW